MTLLTSFERRFCDMLLCLILFFASSVTAPNLTATTRDALQVEFENDRIRVLRVHYAPHEIVQMRDHPAQLIVSLSGSQTRQILPRGMSREFRIEAGGVRWAGRERYAVENLSDQTSEEIIIELKRAAAPAVAVAPRTSLSQQPKEPMPASLEPHHHIEYENQYVRVLEVSLAPGESSLFHTHVDDVIYVTLADAVARGQEMGKEWGEPTEFKAGDVSVNEASRAPFTHHLQNVGTTQFRTINIEILPS